MIPFILAFGPLDTPKLLKKLAIHRRLKPFSSSSLIYSSISSYYLNVNQNNAYIRHYKDTGIKTHEITWLYLWKKNKSRLSSLFICLLLFKRSLCGLPSEVPLFNSGIIMKAPSTEQLLEQNGKSNTYDCVIKCDCYYLLIKGCPQAKLLIMVNR